MRNIFIVNAIQVVISENHPEGAYSVISGYPKTYDSRNYDATAENPNGNPDKALNAAKSEYFSRLSAIYVGSASRVMATVSLTQIDGRIILRESVGSLPDMTPEVIPETTPEVTPTPEPEVVEG